MDMAVQQGVQIDIVEKIKTMSKYCKIDRIEEMLSDCLEGLPNESSIKYVGELNKNDIMH